MTPEAMTALQAALREARARVAGIRPLVTNSLDYDARFYAPLSLVQSNLASADAALQQLLSLLDKLLAFGDAHG